MAQSISSYNFRRAAIGLLLILGPLFAADQQYVAFFSAETESYRRIVLDGVFDRRVQVRRDSLGVVTINIWGVRQEDYVGRRHYEQGYLVPVSMQIDFPKRNLMTITISGNRFTDIVRYRLVEPKLYIVDLYPEPLPQESIFNEQSITALWPEGRFQPDMGAGTIQPELPPPPVEGTKRLGIARAMAWELQPYVGLLKKALIWAGGASLGLLMLTFLLLGRRGKGKAADISTAHSDHAYEQAQALMEQDGNLSYDEATLLADLEHEPARATA